MAESQAPRSFDVVSPVVDPDLLALLICPQTGQTLEVCGDGLVSADKTHYYPVVGGVPYLIPTAAADEHHRQLIESNCRYLDGAELSNERARQYLQHMLVPTCGNLFRGVALSGRLPIPDMRTFSEPGFLVDVGCNWGRWTVAAARAGYRPLGVDLHLEGLLVAKRLVDEMGVRAWFVAADARHLPFQAGSFVGALSYSVLQHLSLEDARAALSEIRRVLAPNGRSRVQMANCAGIRSRMNLANRGFRQTREFDVRYYGLSQMLRLFESTIGPSRWEADCFLGLNVHASDRELVGSVARLVIDAAETLRRLSTHFPPLAAFADSVWVESVPAQGYPATHAEPL